MIYKISFYVPESHLELVKTALFNTGAGTMNGYDQCAWQMRGEGQFRPLTGSQPFLGAIGQLETVTEYKVEMVCDEAQIKNAILALLHTHPYQQPAYAVYPILTLEDFGILQNNE